MTALAPLRPEDPAELGFPPTLPVELALKTAPVAEICAAYGLTRDDFERLKADPVFVAELGRCLELVRKEGMTFRLKAQLQAEELLRTSWKLIHDKSGEVPPSVQADLIKFTIRAAGLDGSKDQAAGAQVTPLQINIQLG